MYNQQLQPPTLNNDTAIKILWGGVISYAIGFVTPQIVAPGYDLYFYTWEILSTLGLGMILVSIALTYKAITGAKKFEGIRKFGISGAVLMLLPIAVISDAATLDTDYYGYEIVETAFGYYLLWLGVILSTIGSLKAASYPSYFYGTYGQAPGFGPQYQQYAQNPQQQYSQQPYQQQSGQPQNIGNPQQNYGQQTPTQFRSDFDTQPAKPIDTHSNIPSNQNVEFGNFCGNCGYNNDGGVKFCVNCGAVFS